MLYQTNFAPLASQGSSYSAFSASYAIPSDSGDWDFIVFDSLGRKLTSSVVHIVITNAPGSAGSITLEPKDQTNILGGTVLFLSSASGISPVSYQWFRQDGTALVESTNYLHVTATNLYVSYIKPSDETGYYMVATDLNSNSSTTRVARLTIAQTPVFTLNPVDAAATEGGNATFTVNVSCNVPFTLNWLFNGSILDAKATNLVYTLSNIPASYNKVRFSAFAQTPYSSAFSTDAFLTISSTGLVASSQGQQWVKILDTDMRVPGYTNLFTKNNQITSPYRGAWDNTYRPAFTIKDRTIHLSVPAGLRTYTNAISGAVVQRAIVRWRSNLLETLVFTNTVSPDGFKFTTLGDPTDEENGVINFTGFTTNSPQALFELRNGVITPIAREQVDLWPTGPGYLDNIYAVVRRGNTVLFSANSTSLKPGSSALPVALFVCKSPGQFTTLVDETLDLPGALGNFSGVNYTILSSRESIAFDGTNVAFIATAQGSGNTLRKGLYLSDLSGNVTKLADDADTAAGFAFNYTNFTLCDLRDGIARFVASGRAYELTLGSSPSYQGLGSVFFSGSGPAGYLLSGNSLVKRTASASSYVLSIPPTWVIDGRRVTALKQMRSDGGDVVVDVNFEDGSSGVYAHFAPDVLPVAGAPVTISAPSIGGGNVSFNFPTKPGKLYQVDRSFTLPFWSYLEVFSGDGNPHQVSTPYFSTGANYIRVFELP